MLFHLECITLSQNLTVCDIVREQFDVLVNEWGFDSSVIKNADWSSFLLLEIIAYYSKR